MMSRGHLFDKLRTQSNLFMVFRIGRFDVRDIAEIANLIVRQAADISVHIVDPRDTAMAVSTGVWNRPSLTVSFVGRSGRFVPPRGPIMENRPITKIEQYHRMVAANLPMPKTQFFRKGESYGEQDWGAFVVLKPADLKMTSHGKGVRLMRTRRLNEMSMSASAVPEMTDTLVQSFIDSGPLPTIWRAMTLFGHTLYCMKSWSPQSRQSLDAPDAAIESTIIEPKQPEIVKAHEVSAMRALVDDREVTEFACRVHETVPSYPLLGCDIIRDAETGKLSLIEMNAGGNVWHFSSRRASRGLAVITREHRIGQYGAWNIAADVLIEKVRKFAS